MSASVRCRPLLSTHKVWPQLSVNESELKYKPKNSVAGGSNEESLCVCVASGVRLG